MSKTIDQSLFQKVLTDIGDDASPNKEKSIRQAITDLEVDIERKNSELKIINDKMSDISELQGSIDLNGDPFDHLLIQILMIRRKNLSLDLEKVTNIIAKMEKKKNSLEEDLNVVLWNRDTIEVLILKGRFK